MCFHVFPELWKCYISNFRHFESSIFERKYIPTFFLAIFSFCAVMVSSHTTHEPYSHAFTQSNISFYSFFSQDVRGIFKFHIQTLDAEKELEPHTTDFRTACWFKVSLTADRTLQGTGFITCPASAHSASQRCTEAQTFKVSCSLYAPRLFSKDSLLSVRINNYWFCRFIFNYCHWYISKVSSSFSLFQTQIE